MTSEKKPVVRNKRSSTEKVGKKHRKELLKLIISTLKKEKAEEIVAIDLNNRTEIADYMVICSGRSTRQVSSIAEKITDSIKKDFRIVSKIEGKTQGDWVLIDSGDIIIHVFRPEVREFYQLEKMWDQNKASVNI
ncbi:MAG: ribosome silencing factor [Rhodobacteraceae bacterium]|nr:ribosome silencing factor [Paracoccaceae bacterium]